MNKSEKQELGITLNNLAMYYGRNISVASINMMIEDLKDFKLYEVLRAIRIYRTNSQNKGFPLPANLIEILCPEKNSKSEAIEAASKIIFAVTKFGYSNEEAAKKYVGDLAWHIVQRFGGWAYICQNLGTNLDLTVFQSQVRELARVTIERNEKIIPTQKQQLNPSENVLGLLNSNDLRTEIGAT